MTRLVALAAAALAASFWLPSARAAEAASPARYMPRGTCAGFPKVDLKTPAGFCTALLATAGSGLRFPRRVLEVAPGRFWLVDMGSWEPNRGRLLEFSLPADAKGGVDKLAFTVLAEKLDRPLGLALGPDGKVWVGEAGRIVRTPVGALGTPARFETVVAGLAATGAHPLKEIAFGANGRLYFNVGSATDACRGDDGQQPAPCTEVDGPAPRAAVWEAILSAGPAFNLQTLRPFARGLRNSVALAFVPGPDVLLQGENSIDYTDDASPPEELNVLLDGVNYGWPYCTGKQQPARGYEKRFDCAATQAPQMLWPAHAAPLQMLAVPAASKSPFAGQLLVAWHGYRSGGHRVVGYTLDAKGLPTGPAKAWIEGWTAQPGVRPLGAPTGIALDSAGRLLIVEDRHKTLLMLTRDAP